MARRRGRFLDTSTSLSETYTAVRVPPHEVHDAWAIARPFIARAHNSRVATGDAFLEDIYARVLLGEQGPLRAALWIAYCGTEAVGAMVTQEVRYERGAVVQIPYLAGDQFDRWVHLLDDVLADSARRGFEEIELLARDGFGPVLADYGAEKKWTLFRLRAN